ncbi:hypothetical protein Tco_0611542 [Tanacetum coccineum]
MLVPQVVEGEGSVQPSEPQPPSSTAPPSQVTTVATHHQKTHKPRVVRAATTTSSLEAEQESDNIHKTRPTATLNEPSPQGLGSGSGPRRQDTTLRGADAQTWFETASKKSHDPPLSEGTTFGSGEDSMEHQVDLTNFVPPTPHDSPLSGGHTPESNEDCSRPGDPAALKESQKIGKCTKGKNSKNEALQDCNFDVLDDAMENVEGGSTAKQITTAGDTLNTASISVSTAGPSNVSAASPSISTAGDIFEDEMTTIADTLMAIRSARPRTTLVMIRNVEEEPRRATPVPTMQRQYKGKCKMVEPEPTPKNPRKAQIQRLFEEEQTQFEKEQRIAREKAAEQETKDAALIEQMEDVQARTNADELLAERLQQKEREQFAVEEQVRMLVDLIAESKKFFAAQRAEQIRNKPPTRAQLMNKMVTYLKHIGNYTHTQLKSKSFEEIQKFYEKEQKWINVFVPLDSVMVKDSGKKDGDSQKQAESSKKRPRAEHDEESVKKQKLEDEAEREELRACLDIVPRDDITMDFESLASKYPIIDWKTHILTENMMYYQIIRANRNSKNYKIFSGMLDDFDRQDVIDLYRLNLLEPSEEDEIWNNQQDYNLISWRLFDSCGVHVLLMDTGIAIHIMVENTYPLTQEMISRMLNRRLEVDHESEMAFELLRFTRSQLQK